MFYIGRRWSGVGLAAVLVLSLGACKHSESAAGAQATPAWLEPTPEILSGLSTAATTWNQRFETRYPESYTMLLQRFDHGVNDDFQKRPQRALYNCSIQAFANLLGAKVHQTARDAESAAKYDDSVVVFWETDTAEEQMAGITAYLAHLSETPEYTATFGIKALKHSRPKTLRIDPDSIPSSPAGRWMAEHPVGTRFILFLYDSKNFVRRYSHFIYGENIQDPSQGRLTALVDTQPDMNAEIPPIFFAESFDFTQIDMPRFDMATIWAVETK